MEGKVDSLLVESYENRATTIVYRYQNKEHGVSLRDWVWAWQQPEGNNCPANMSVPLARSILVDNLKLKIAVMGKIIELDDVDVANLEEKNETHKRAIEAAGAVGGKRAHERGGGLVEYLILRDHCTVLDHVVTSEFEKVFTSFGEDTAKHNAVAFLTWVGRPLD